MLRFVRNNFHKFIAKHEQISANKRQIINKLIANNEQINNKLPANIEQIMNKTLHIHSKYIILPVYIICSLFANIW